MDVWLLIRLDQESEEVPNNHPLQDIAATTLTAVTGDRKSYLLNLDLT